MRLWRISTSHIVCRRFNEGQERPGLADSGEADSEPFKENVALKFVARINEFAKFCGDGRKSSQGLCSIVRHCYYRTYLSYWISEKTSRLSSLLRPFRKVSS